MKTFTFPNFATAARRAALALFTLSAALGAIPASAATGDGDSAVVLLYHRFGEAEYPSTNIRLEQFEEHLRILTSGEYNVLPLAEITAAIRDGRTLPDRTVAITVDDAFLSVYQNAWPRLQAAGLPWTLFVSTRAVDSGRPGYMNWEQIRELQSAGVDIGAHGVDHVRLPRLGDAAADWQISASAARLREMLGVKPVLFSYPYGEAGASLMRQVEAEGFLAAFGQHSGPMTAAHDRWYLPRFAINEQYGETERFRFVVNTLGLPASNVTPADPLLNRVEGDNPPTIGFTLPPELAIQGNALACYPSNASVAHELFRLGADNDRIELRFAAPLAPGRMRVNCTMPEKGRWRWFGMLFHILPQQEQAATPQ